MDEDFDAFLPAYTTPSISRHNKNGSRTATATSTKTQQTPLPWMTEQRNKRKGRKGYGRRASRMVGGDLDFGGMDMNDDTKEKEEGLASSLLDSSAHARLEGNNNNETTASVTTTTKKYPRRIRSLRSSSPDLNSSLEEQEVKKAKKKRPNYLPSKGGGKPPLAGAFRAVSVMDSNHGMNDVTAAVVDSASTANATASSVNSRTRKAAATPSFKDNNSENNSIASRTRSGNTPFFNRSFSTNNIGGSALDFSAQTTPAVNTRRRLRRSQSVEQQSNSTAAANAAASAAARLLEENVHPNDVEKPTVVKAAPTPLTERRTRSTKKRTASITGIDVKASPPKMNNRKTSISSSSSSSFTFSNEESFSNLAKRDAPSWGHHRSLSQNYGCKTPSMHHRSHTLGCNDWNSSVNSQSTYLSPSMAESSLETPMIIGAERKEANSKLMGATPLVCDMLSPPSASSLFASPSGSEFGANMDVARDAGSDNESMSSCDEDSVQSSSSEESSVELTPPRKLTDVEIFNSKPSYKDFKFLLNNLMQWSRSTNKQGKVASMGLNNGCQIAVPKWDSQRKANFVKWASISCGFRVSNAGAGITILRCLESEGLEILKTLRRILADHKAGRLDVAIEEKPDEIVTDSNSHASQLLPKPVTTAKTVSTAGQMKPPSVFPFCDEDEELAESFEKQVNIQKKSSKLPSLRRSISLQPITRPNLKSPMSMMSKSPLSMMSRRLRLSSDSHATQFSIDSDRKMTGPPPRMSSESIDPTIGTDFLSQIHCADPFSPIRDNFKKIRQHVGRTMLNPKRPSVEKPRLSFERCARSKPYESPHPNSDPLVQNTPIPRSDFGCDRPWETPMPKQVENWGSRPIKGKDWGNSTCCDSSALKCCTRVFAQSWFKSDFNNNVGMCDTYKISFPDNEQSSLHESYNSDSDVEIDEDYDGFDLSPVAPPAYKLKLRRDDSVGGSALALLNLGDDKDTNPSKKHASRRSLKLRKYRRMSLCATASDFSMPKIPPNKQIINLPDVSLMNDIVGKGRILTSILSYFDLAELLQSTCLVNTIWADASTEVIGSLMLASVGCNPNYDDEDLDLDTPRDEWIDKTNSQVSKSSSIARSMERDWTYFENFTSGKFLSEGAFKKVFKVWNKHHRIYEALSVMDVDAITESGYLHTVGAELAVSALLSSIARRNIAPNFVITRGIFTCQYDLPVEDWDNDDGGEVIEMAHKLAQGECGNFQFIRMELCKHKDTEEYLRKLPTKMLSPSDCRNVLFQMAFALDVARRELEMKHYDIKLLNFFLQSALDDSTPEYLHPHVVLRYGVGSSVFRLRMPPSTAVVVKLADYGTSVLGSDCNGQPISIAQFTTFENTPPEYLILGNDAKQGYGHDYFGLGLSMLHLFTGHCPYEEILEDVVCPESLKTKLRRIWKSQTHDIIRNAMMYEDSDGNEVEDETFYHTLYRFIVLFGMPKKKIKGEGSNNKVRRAIKSTILKPGCHEAIAFESHRGIFSLATGNNEIIANARRRLEGMDGAMELLLRLVCFDPAERAAPIDVINSKFMSALLEGVDSASNDCDIIRSYMHYSNK